jgi:predicted AAA+ superfamily ATPase
MTDPADLIPYLSRIADALDRLSPPAPAPLQLDGADAFVWDAGSGQLTPVAHVARLRLDLLRGIDRVRDILLENTQRFANGLPANNALLWGARGMGKSSLVKAVHGSIIAKQPSSLKLIEIHREDIASLPQLMRGLRDCRSRCLLLCDDLSFEVTDTAYKSLKTVLDGGLEGRPSNVLLYATSNRRHLMPRDMVENEQSTAINPGEAVEEKVSLSDRFGLWLGFHNCSQDDYLAMVEGYVTALNLPVTADHWRKDALSWAAGRGARSGRVAFQFIQDLAGRLGAPINPHAID